MLKSVFTIGHNYNDENGSPKTWAAEKVAAIVAGIFAEYYDGATVYGVRGMWRGAWEQSTRVEVYGGDAAKDREICEYLKKALLQECIAYEQTETAIEFI